MSYLLPIYNSIQSEGLQNKLLLDTIVHLFPHFDEVNERNSVSWYWINVKFSSLDFRVAENLTITKPWPCTLLPEKNNTFLLTGKGHHINSDMFLIAR